MKSDPASGSLAAREHVPGHLDRAAGALDLQHVADDGDLGTGLFEFKQLGQPARDRPLAWSGLDDDGVVGQPDIPFGEFAPERFGDRAVLEQTGHGLWSLEERPVALRQGDFEHDVIEGCDRLAVDSSYPVTAFHPRFPGGKPDLDESDDRLRGLDSQAERRGIEQQTGDQVHDHASRDNGHPLGN